jgi:hypothetical protein
MKNSLPNVYLNVRRKYCNWQSVVKETSIDYSITRGKSLLQRRK